MSFRAVKESLTIRLEFLGAWLLILGCFAVPVLGTAATNIFLLSALGVWLLDGQFKVLPLLARQYPLIQVSLGLFFWLGLSALWSSSFTENILYLSKYREFFMIPAFMWVLTQKEYRTLALKALFLGMLLTLVISFLQYFHVATFHGRQHNIGNHIFHGILFGFFGYWCLDLARKYRAYAWLFVLLFLVSSFALLEIQASRTGYVLFSLLTGLFLLQHFGWKVLTVGLMIIGGIFYSVLEPSQILDRADNLSLLKEAATLQSLAALDIRLEFYIFTLKIIAEHWFLGVGLGDFDLAYLTIWDAGHLYSFTTNPHNEYLMIWSQSGLVGIGLFIVFHWTFFKMARHLSKDDVPLAMATLITLIVSCSFNSSFLDMNDGALLLILSSLFLAPGVKHIDLVNYSAKKTDTHSN
ncbi:MAG TPA: O-antigen ligase domain-containing protein [Methylococcaceae bacterium]|nr:O-antigen ligase domain-containing protein [Methylococcaceae bacterium]HIA44695.1 O-antigen ligase domain-containing protein [Methylococcaceae bacterium]HIB61729.1 O-antigen ligase domain-containing protein [Methylococcaceae bacterium]